jgi:DNA polymerase-3 subunit alpha
MSSISVDDIINHALKNKQTHVCLVDINNMYGCIEFYNKAKAAKLHPIIGLQITYQNEKVVLIAKNNDGYHNLIKISSRVMCNETYDLNDYASGLAIIVDNLDNFKWLKHKNDVYSSDSHGTNPLALQECYFEQPSDLKYVKALMAIANDSKITEYENNHEFDERYMLSESQANKKFSTQALDNLDNLIKSCTWDITSNVINFIKYDPKVNSKILLQTKCKEGLKQRLNSNDAPEAYIDRLIKELQIIDQMHFNDYFLVVQDYVNFAKRNGILVGPGRGSAAGSLVSYVLGITDIDPIAYDLIFERFLNPSRATMPDIDIDFMDNRRNEVVDYLFERYKNDHVAQITTFQRMKAKMAIRDAGRVLGLELPIINNISKAISAELDLDFKEEVVSNKNIKAYADKYPELFDLATKFVNYPRQIGLHAAGVVISGTKLDEVIPVQSSTNNAIATQYSMEYLEPLGLIKMDILGLVNLTTINETLKLIKKNHSADINLSKIKLDDKKVFDSLTKGDTVGIFQLESPGMRNLIIKIKPKSIEDISITSALFRPGPQKNIPTYLANKANPTSIKYLNDDFKQVLAPTYNIIIYQEQVIEIVKRVANFSLADADSFRRAISKKNADKLMKLNEQFIAGAVKNKYTKVEAEKIFEYIFEFANYGFNHSHSLAYSYISY